MNSMPLLNILGPVLLGLVLLYAVLRNKTKKRPGDDARTEEATRRLNRELDEADKQGGS